MPREQGEGEEEVPRAKQKKKTLAAALQAE